MEKKNHLFKAEIKEMLRGDWNQFETGFFRWSPSRKTVVFYKPRGHKIEEFRIADIGSYNHEFKELLAKLKQFVGTLSGVSLPSTMEQLRKTAMSLGMPRDMDINVFMRKLAQLGGANPAKWDFVRDSGMLSDDGNARMAKLRRIKI